MTNLNYYLQDGACAQARGVLAFLSGLNIEESWSDEKKKYCADIKVARWENCREQGYIVSMHSENYQRQLNIAFFEHRNSDSICAIKWEQRSMNTITIDTAVFGDVYKDKYDTSFSVGYGEVVKMADWISEQLSKFWFETINEKVKEN
jgi:hypothetical protein